MLDLDLRTVVVIASAMGLLMAIVLFSVWRSYPVSIKGPGEWALAALLFSVAAGASAVRGIVPDMLSVGLTNLLLLVANVLLYLGIQRFFEKPPSVRLWSGLAAATGLLMLWFTWFQPHYGLRVSFMASFMTALSLAAAVLLLREGHRSFPAWLVAGVMLLRAVAQVARMVEGWRAPADQGFWTTTPTQTLYVASGSLVVLAIAIGLLLLASSRLHREIEHVARHDWLTQALTRRAFIDACEMELDRCRRHHRDMALLMLDIDHFKGINDARGHQVGDAVIVDFAARITGLLRRSDQLGRYGGEEFVVLLPETGPQEALAVAERIRARIALRKPDLPDYTVSTGVTVNLPGEDRIDTLLKRADAALYQAKAGGRDRVVFV